MSKLVFEKNSIEVEPGYIIEAAEEIGIPFGCREGHCGTCEIRVISGAEHLSPQSEAEIEFGLEEGHRLTCQCIIGDNAHVEISL